MKTRRQHGRSKDTAIVLLIHIHIYIYIYRNIIYIFLFLFTRVTFVVAVAFFVVRSFVRSFGAKPRE